MTVEQLCDSRPGPIMVFACSCGSNVGQLANEGTRRAALDGKVKMACLPGIGIRMETSIQAAKNARKLMAIDGCGMKCGFKILEAAGFAATDHIVVTDLGIVKNLELQLNQDDIERVKSAIIARA